MRVARTSYVCGSRIKVGGFQEFVFLLTIRVFLVSSYYPSTRNTLFFRAAIHVFVFFLFKSRRNVGEVNATENSKDNISLMVLRIKKYCHTTLSVLL